MEGKFNYIDMQMMSLATLAGEQQCRLFLVDVVEIKSLNGVVFIAYANGNEVAV